MSVSATIFNISKCSLNDGPGVRTTVYLKGCDMACRWCHNPESLRKGREISFAAVKCIGCGACAAVCPEHHRMDEGGMTFLRQGCTACGKCADACHTKALSVIGRDYTAEEAFAGILRDKAYYEKTGGGVTLSGGECLLYPEFAAELLRLCRENGIGTLVESAFCVPLEHIEKVIPFTDIFYVDLKLFDPERHRRNTGRDNALILQNIRAVAGRHPHLVVRTPLIPGVNDDRANLEQTARFARECGAKGWELLRFNPLGESKYAVIGQTATHFADEPQSCAEMDALCRELNAFLGTSDFVYYKA